MLAERALTNVHGVFPRIAWLAAAQAGVAHIWQMERLGLSKDAARKRSRAGHMHRVHEGVYAIGHPALGHDGRIMAAVLAGGPEAAAGAGSAIRLHLPSYQGLRAMPPTVVVPRDLHRARPGLRISRATVLEPPDLVTVRNIPTTSLPRTLLDLATLVGEGELREIVARTQRQRPRILEAGALDELIARSRGRRGVAILRDVAADLRPGGGVARRGLEQMFLALCRSLGSPHPG